MATTQVKLVIVDNNLLMTELLTDLFSRQPDFSLVGTAGDGLTGLQLCLDTRPDLVLTDVAMRLMDGLEMLKRLRSERPEIRALVFSGRCDPYTIWRVTQCQADGYLEKTSNLTLLLSVMRRVAQGKFFFSPQFNTITEEKLAEPDSFVNQLSRRELQVLLHMVEGWSNQRMAAEMGISAGTVDVHYRNIRQKLRVHNVRELIAYARTWGIESTVLPSGPPPLSMADTLNPPPAAAEKS